MKKDRINDWLENIAEYLWCDIVDPRLEWDSKNIKYVKTLSFKVLNCLLMYPIDRLIFIWWFLNKRLICLKKGCKIVYYSHWNMPENCNTSGECERCGAYDEFGMSSNHKIIY